MPIEDEMDTPGSAPLVQVTFDATHACGGTHRMSGYQNATPGLDVFRDGPGSVDCGLRATAEDWNIWHLADPGVVVGGFHAPEAATHCAQQLGRFRDWEPRWPIDHRDWRPPDPRPGRRPRHRRRRGLLMAPAPAGRQNGDSKEAAMTEIWTEGAKDAWFRTHEWTDMSAPEVPISHIVTFRPDIRIRVLLPPWADADAWLDEARTGWNDWLPDGGEIWTEPAGEGLIDVQVLGSTDHIDDARSGPAGTNGTTNQPDPARATAQLVLPVDDDLSAALSTLEEIFLELLDVVDDARPAADTAGRLAASVDPDRSDAVQPAVGLTEVVPLAFRLVPPAAVDQLVAVVSRVIAPEAPDDVADTVAEVAHRRHVPGTWGDDGGVRCEITAVLAVLQVDHGDDLDALAQLHQPVAESPCGRAEPDHETVVLRDLEAAAYGRVVDRILRAWRPGDPLARFLYEGR